MEEHEVTIRINGTKEELIKILENQGFKKVNEFILYDTYMIPEEFNDIDKYDERRLLNLSVRIRRYEKSESEVIRKEIVKKDKEFDENNNIIKESKVVCKIKDENEAYELLKVLGYVKLLNIDQKVVDYSNGNFFVCVSDINGRIYIEIEDRDKENNILFNSTDEIIEKVKELKIPHDESEYFVQKAIDELKYLRSKK